MTIAFKDFIPQLQAKHLLGMVQEYEDLREVVTRVNQWIEREHIEVVTIETLLLPRYPKNDDESARVLLEALSAASSVYQMIQVWYKATDRAMEGSATSATIRL